MDISQRKNTNTSTKYQCFKGNRSKGHKWTSAKQRKKQIRVKKRYTPNKSQPVFDISTLSTTKRVNNMCFSYKCKNINKSKKYERFKNKRSKGHKWTSAKQRKKQTRVKKRYTPDKSQAVFDISTVSTTKRVNKMCLSNKRKNIDKSKKYECFKNKRSKGHKWTSAKQRKKQSYFRSRHFQGHECLRRRKKQHHHVMNRVKHQQREYVFVNIPCVKSKKVLIKESTIPDAGNGLFLLEFTRRNERITFYSGKHLVASQARNSDSQYIVQISKNNFLDAKGPDHCAGKFINCGRKAKRKINARLSGSSRFTVCKKTHMKWISVFATCDINASVSHPVEIFMDYGPDYW